MLKKGCIKYMEEKKNERKEEKLKNYIFFLKVGKSIGRLLDWLTCQIQCNNQVLQFSHIKTRENVTFFLLFHKASKNFQ